MSASHRGLFAQGIPSLLLAPCLLGILTPGIGAQLVVDRLEIFLPAIEGGSSGTFLVTNTTEEAITVDLLLQDWERREDGTNQFLEAGTVSGSCHPEARIFPALLLLGPREEQPVQVFYEGSARPTSCWTSVRVRAVPPARTEPTEAVQVNIEIHQYVKVYVEPESGWGDVELRDADILPAVRGSHRTAANTSTYDVVAVATNPGNVQVLVSGLVEFRALDNTVVNRSPFGDAPILPGALRQMRVPIPELPPGRYVVLVLLDAGGPERAAAQIDLEIGP